MFKDKTDLVKILKTVIGGILVSQIVACSKNLTNNYSDQTNSTSTMKITGGKQIDPLSRFGKKIIYLALGVTFTPVYGRGETIDMENNCTAVAITPTVLLTAGHCVQPFGTKQIYAVLGGDPWKNAFNQNNWIAVESVLLHESYLNDTDNGISDNDLALLKLNRPLSNDYILPLATDADVVSLSHTSVQKMYEVGYGIHDIKLENTNQKTEQSLNLAVKTFDKSQFQNIKIEIEQRDGIGFCMGDSGSPGLIVNQNDIKILGVASYIKSSKKDRDFVVSNMEQPCRGLGVYTNLLKYQDWIQRSLSRLQ